MSDSSAGAGASSWPAGEAARLAEADRQSKPDPGSEEGVPPAESAAAGANAAHAAAENARQEQAQLHGRAAPSAPTREQMDMKAAPPGGSPEPRGGGGSSGRQADTLSRTASSQMQAQMQAQLQAQRAQMEAQMEAQRAQMQAQMEAQLEAQRAQLEAERAQMEAQMQAEMRAQQEEFEQRERELEERNKAVQVAPNIKDRLDGGEWQDGPDRNTVGSIGAWWEGTKDCSAQVNRLRTMARLRSSFPEDAFPAFPQLVVVGDCNTAKSTVLNRFAQFNFSAVKDEVCTKRPIRLELRAPSVQNVQVLQSKKHPLDAIVTMTDKHCPDEILPPFKIRSAYRAKDEATICEFVKKRASTSKEERAENLRQSQRLSSLNPRQRAAKAAYDTYLVEELVIRYEALGMIHFDLIDLPGRDARHDKTKELIANYVNTSTLDSSFMLIFQACPGKTTMAGSVCYSQLRAIEKQASKVSPSGDRWLDKQSFGVLTKVDRMLETPEKAHDGYDPAQYDRKARDDLSDQLMGRKHEDFDLAIHWTAVMNPNTEEQLTNMSFDQATKKEAWYFDNLFQPGRNLSDSERQYEESVAFREELDGIRKRCGISSFRSTLIEKYEHFAADKFLNGTAIGRGEPVFPAERVLNIVLQEFQRMEDTWGWGEIEERYDQPAEQRQFVQRCVEEIVNNETVVKVAEVLNSTRLNDHTGQKGPEGSWKRLLNSVTDASSGNVNVANMDEETTVERLLLPLKVQADEIKAKVNARCQLNKYKRFAAMIPPVVDATGALMELFLQYAETQLREEFARAKDVAANDDMRNWNPAIQNMGGPPFVGLIFTVQKLLVDLAKLVRGMPSIPALYLRSDPDAALEHTALKQLSLTKAQVETVEVERHDCLRVAQDWFHPIHQTLAIPRGAIITHVNGQLLSKGISRDEFSAKLGDSPQHVVTLTFCKSALLIEDVPARLEWLLPTNLLPEYKQERDQFMLHRRAAELLIIVFGQGFGHNERLPGLRQDFNRKNTNPLVRLGSYGPDHFRPYHGDAPVLDAPDTQGVHADEEPPVHDVMVGPAEEKQAGFCAAPRCFRPHDTCFEPCGHAVCCWKCVNQLETTAKGKGQRARCPVCAVEITGKQLCYPEYPEQQDVQGRRGGVHLATMEPEPEPDMSSEQPKPKSKLFDSDSDEDEGLSDLFGAATNNPHAGLFD